MRINVRGGTVRSSDPSLCLTCHATGRNSLMPRPRTCLGDGRDAVRDARRAPPLVADGEQPLIHRIRHDEPTALERVRPGVPPALATLVSRCLSKSAPARYPDAGALLGALRAVDAGAAVHTRQPWRHSRVTSVLVAFALAAAGAMALWSALPVRGDAPGVVAVWNAGDRLAVLPLAYESPDPEDAYFAEAMTDELITGLSGMAGLRVISRASIMTYQDRGSDVDLAGASRELGAAALLAGTLHRTAQSVRLSLQLVDAATQERLWTAELETDAADVPALSRAAAAHVAAALQVSRAAAPLGAVADRAPERADAHTEYLRGRYGTWAGSTRRWSRRRRHRSWTRCPPPRTSRKSSSITWRAGTTRRLRSCSGCLPRRPMWCTPTTGWG